MSSAFCLLYKLFTLKMTKKQVIGLITHKDSPYIRGLGFMYIRYVQVTSINVGGLWKPPSGCAYVIVYMNLSLWFYGGTCAEKPSQKSQKGCLETRVVFGEDL